MPNLSQLIQDFFCQNLINQRNLSHHTIAAYRDTFRLLLRYASEQLKKRPVKLSLDDLNMSVVLRFLNYLETQRKNSVRTRNIRFAAIRSFMNYAAYREPGSLPGIQQVLSIPMKRFQRPLLGSLSREEIETILQAPDPTTWSGRRDRIMFTVFYNTGARVSEIIGLKIKDLQLNPKASVHIYGKGRKERIIPLWKTTTAMLKGWLRQGGTPPQTPVFPNRFGKELSAAGIEHRLRIAVREASKLCPSLRNRKISPHTLRHATALHLLQSGVDLSVIALWLGHESPATTHMYMEADLTMKEKALERLHETGGPPIRYKADDALLRFLEGL
jgi:site-specific recombinase XerD